MSSEPALMSLTAVAKAIADKRVSSREVSQSCLARIARWQPHLNAFMAIEADEALKAADAADAAIGTGGRRGPLHGVPLAHKDMYYETGKVVTCGSRIRREFVAATTSTALQRLKDAGTVRLGSLQMAEFALWSGAQSLRARSHHRRFFVRIGCRRRRTADICRLGLRHRRFDPHAGALLRGHGAEDHRRPDQPRRCNAAVAIA
jgi:hypothetical protein